MKISFIIPVYNAEKYVAGCIASLYRQGLSNDEFEIICINDDSTDNSLNVLQMYADSNTNVKIKNQTRQGVSCARNAGISMARGQYIWFIDADDYIANNVVGKLLSLAYQYDLDMLFTAHIPTDREDCYDSTFGEYPQILHVKTGREFLERKVLIIVLVIILSKKNLLTRIQFALWKDDTARTVFLHCHRYKRQSVLHNVM